MTTQPQERKLGPGALIKEELKSRGVSQKDFATAVGVTQSYLSDILSGRRRLSLQFAQQVESLLGVSSRILLDLQTAREIVSRAKSQGQTQEIEANETLMEIDKEVSVQTLLKSLKIRFVSSSERLKALNSYFGIGVNLSHELSSITKGCFRKSANTGLDKRMITTWIVLAKAVSKYHTPMGKFEQAKIPNLCHEVSRLLHNNSHTLFQLESVMSYYGIGLIHVEKVDRASIDGFSFYSNGYPFVAITCRYDRIDNLAFTVLHELGHIFYGHTSPERSSLNIDTRSFDDEFEDEKELQADQFAGDYLISPSLWKFAPKVTSNPWAIQSAYTKWARKNNLNQWIVLGRLSHETGMYKFRSDETRKINGGREVCHEIIV